MSTSMQLKGWLLLLYSLPTAQTTARVSLWRRLQKLGALQLKTSAYLLPDHPPHHERFQWLAKQVRDDGGDATLIRVTDIEGLTAADMVALFNNARARDYRELMKAATDLIKRHRQHRDESFAGDLEKVRRRFQELVAIDYFDCPGAHDARILLNQAEGLARPGPATLPRLAPARFRGRTWVTRPRPEIDRVGSAWLIRKFIDSRARFVFATDPSKHPRAVPYDLFDAGFTHHGEDCTFETLLNRFEIKDRAARQIGEMIHDADLDDGKFQRREAFGLDRVFKGWARLGWTDSQILARGFACFDALYATLES